MNIPPGPVFYARDRREEVDHVFQEALRGADVVLSAGGVSVGKYDLVRDALAHQGVEEIFWKVAVKPGKPTALAVAGPKLIFGLPGYPTSALSNYYILLEPILEKMTGQTVRKSHVTAKMERKVYSTVGRYQFLPVKIEGGIAVPVMRGSSSITTLANADGFVEIEENVEVIEKGSTVNVRLF